MVYAIDNEIEVIYDQVEDAVDYVYNTNQPYKDK